jgi:hypothetical protein
MGWSVAFTLVSWNRSQKSVRRCKRWAAVNPIENVRKRRSKIRVVYVVVAKKEEEPTG